MKPGILTRLIISFLICTIICGVLPTDSAYAAYGKPYYIEVDLTNQIVTIYNTSDNSIARQMLCSAGMNDCTPTGTWYMSQKEKPEERTKWYYFQSFKCYAQYASRIFGQYFFHSITFNRKSDNAMSKTAAAAFGNPASHGCIRLRVEDAKFIASNCYSGTRVKIYKSNESDEELRQLLYVSTYVQEEMTYSEFMGYSEDSLGRGSTGQEVADLQSRLHELGYFENGANGTYDTETIASVKQLQKDLGMAQTGVVNAALSEVIYSEEAPVSDGLIMVYEGQKGPTVKKLQKALSKLKFYSGEIDGIYDLDVAIAVDEFQTMCGYDVDGRYASPEVQKALYYEISAITEAVGTEFTITKEDESVNMAKVVTPDKVRINVRSKPDTKSDAIGQVKYGEKVMINATNDSWAQIICRAGTGFLMKKYLEPYTATNSVWVFTGTNGNEYRIGHTIEEYMSGAVTEASRIASYLASEQFSKIAADADYCTVTTGSDDITLNMRTAPNPQAEIITTIANGTQMRVISQDDNWTKAGYNNSIGYLMNDYLTFWTGTTDDVISTAGNGIGVSEDDADSVDGESYGSDDYSEANITAVVVPDKKGKSVPVYAEDDEDSEQIAKLKADSEVHVIGVNEETGWCLISEKGKQGYVKDINLSFRLGNGI